MAVSGNSSVGSFTGNGAAKTVTLGYQPCDVWVTDETTGIFWHYHNGLAATKCEKFNNTGPVISITTNSDVAVTSSGFTLSATANVNAATISYRAIRLEP